MRWEDRPHYFRPRNSFIQEVKPEYHSSFILSWTIVWLTHSPTIYPYVRANWSPAITILSINKAWFPSYSQEVSTIKIPELILSSNKCLNNFSREYLFFWSTVNRVSISEIPSSTLICGWTSISSKDFSSSRARFTSHENPHTAWRDQFHNVLSTYANFFRSRSLIHIVSYFARGYKIFIPYCDWFIHTTSGNNRVSHSATGTPNRLKQSSTAFCTWRASSGQCWFKSLGSPITNSRNNFGAWIVGIIFGKSSIHGLTQNKPSPYTDIESLIYMKIEIYRYIKLYFYLSTTFFRKTIVFLIFLLYSEPYPMVW